MSGQIAHRGKADVPTIWTVREDRVNRRAEVTEAEDGYDVIVAGQRYAVRGPLDATIAVFDGRVNGQPFPRSEEHTSELQSLMRLSYAVFCLKKKKKLRSK